MYLAHSCKQLLTRAVVATDDEGRVLFGQPTERGDDLVLLALLARLQSKAHDGLRELNRWHLDAGAVNQHVARRRFLQLSHRSNVAAGQTVDRLVFLPLKREQLTDALLRAGARIRKRRVARNAVAVGPENADASRERGRRSFLKMNTAAPSTSTGASTSAGDGATVAIASRSADVPTFDVAAPHRTGKSSPAATAFRSAPRSSSAAISSPSR